MCFSIWETPYWGSAPELRWGTSVPRPSQYLICVKLFKMPLKFVTVNDNVFQHLGDFVPSDLLLGLRP